MHRHGVVKMENGGTPPPTVALADSAREGACDVCFARREPRLLTITSYIRMRVLKEPCYGM